jgi:hypothetical protein
MVTPVFWPKLFDTIMMPDEAFVTVIFIYK